MLWAANSEDPPDSDLRNGSDNVGAMNDPKPKKKWRVWSALLFFDPHTSKHMTFPPVDFGINDLTGDI